MSDVSENKWAVRTSRKVASQQATIISAIFFLAGVICYLTPLFWTTLTPAIAKVLENLSFGFLFPVIFSLIWERTVSPLMADELIAKIGLKRSVVDLGLETLTYDGDGEWDGLLSSANSIEVYFDLDGTWWQSHKNAIQKAIKRGCKMRVVVFDASDTKSRNVADKMIKFQKNLRDESTTQTEFYFQHKHVANSNIEVRRSNYFPLNSVIVVDDQIFYRINRIYSFDSNFLCLGTQTKKGLGQALRIDLDSLWDKAFVA